MIIKPQNVRRMLLLETAAADWFTRMNRNEQEAYKKAHPHSKFSRRGVSAPPSEGEAPTKGPYRMSMHVNDAEAHPKGLAHNFNKKGFYTSLKPVKDGEDCITHQLNVHYHPQQARELLGHMKKLGGDETFGHDPLYNRLKGRASRMA